METDRPKHAIYLRFKIVNVQRSLALVSCCALLLYLYERDFLIQFPSYHIRTGDLPVPGPFPLWPSGLPSCCQESSEEQQRQLLPWTSSKKTPQSKILQTFFIFLFFSPSSWPGWRIARSCSVFRRLWNMRESEVGRERGESCPRCWNESTARGLVCYYGYSCLYP